MNTSRARSVFHLKLANERTLCNQEAEPERFTFATLHNVTCAECLTVATTIVHAARGSRRVRNG